MTNIIRFLFGYVIFEGVCNYPSKLLNIATKNKINMWGVVCNNFSIKGYIRASEYRYLHSISATTGLHIHIVKKTGLPFLIKRYKIHIGLLVGSFIFIAVLVVGSMFVWRLDISELKLISSDEVESVLSDYGAKPGAFIKSIDTKVLEQKLTKTLNDISWVSININGCVLQVEIKECSEPPEIDKSIYVSDLVALQDGQITRSELYSGKALVKPGDVVQKGQVLAQGILEDENGNVTALKRSVGKIFANTIRATTQSVSLIKQEKVYTEKPTQKKYIQLFNMSLPYTFSAVPDKDCDMYEEKERRNIIGTSIPVIFCTQTFYPFELKESVLDISKAQEELKEKVLNYENDELKDAVILHKDENYYVEDNEYKVNVVYSCEENIAHEKIINFS